MSASRHTVTGGAIAVLILVTIAVSSGAGRSLLGPPEHHADGEGPLASSNQTGTLGQILVDRIGERRWTFGYPLCLAQGDQAAIIQSVGPTRTVGEGFTYLGSLMRTFDVEPGETSKHEPIGSVSGFPPPAQFVPDYLSDAIGYSVSVRCNRQAPTYTELLVGFAAIGDDGGGWLGIDVGYTVGGHHHVVSLGYDQLICGASTADRCDGGQPSPSTTGP